MCAAPPPCGIAGAAARGAAGAGICARRSSDGRRGTALGCVMWGAARSIRCGAARRSSWPRAMTGGVCVRARASAARARPLLRSHAFFTRSRFRASCGSAPLRVRALRARYGSRCLSPASRVPSHRRGFRSVAPARVRPRHGHATSPRHRHAPLHRGAQRRALPPRGRSPAAERSIVNRVAKRSCDCRSRSSGRDGDTRDVPHSGSTSTRSSTNGTTGTSISSNIVGQMDVRLR